MPRMYDVSERNLFGMKTDILEKEGTWLAEIGLLVVLLHNKGKDMKDALKKIRDDKSVIDFAMQKLSDDGFVLDSVKNGEEITRVSDEPKFSEEWSDGKDSKWNDLWFYDGS